MRYRRAGVDSAVGYTIGRIYVGDYWRSDVLAGYLFGTLWLASPLHPTARGSAAGVAGRDPNSAAPPGVQTESRGVRPGTQPAIAGAAVAGGGG